MHKKHLELNKNVAKTSTVRNTGAGQALSSGNNAGAAAAFANKARVVRHDAGAAIADQMIESNDQEHQ